MTEYKINDILAFYTKMVNMVNIILASVFHKCRKGYRLAQNMNSNSYIICM